MPQPDHAPPDGENGKAAFPGRRTVHFVLSECFFLYLLCDSIYQHVIFVGKITKRLVIFLPFNIFYAKGFTSSNLRCPLYDFGPISMSSRATTAT
ncbi:MAG: hypothetical protein V4639_02585 [Pseudomonadota bacterium]|uniref:hypothetical protein n=1 Tax=Polaromonas sp. YR568 TaxID=1855301 RepID=UPI00313840A3